MYRRSFRARSAVDVKMPRGQHVAPNLQRRFTISSCPNAG